MYTVDGLNKNNKTKIQTQRNTTYRVGSHSFTVLELHSFNNGDRVAVVGEKKKYLAPAPSSIPGSFRKFHNNNLKKNSKYFFGSNKKF